MQGVGLLAFALQTERRQFAGLTSKTTSWNWQKVDGREAALSCIRYGNI